METICVRASFALVLGVAALAACTAPVPTQSAAPTTNPTAVVGATSAVMGKGTWTAETGIYGTYNHFGNPPNGPPTYLCGVGYNVNYVGGAPLVFVDVSVLFPDAFAKHVTQSTIDRVLGWQHTAVQINSPQPRDAAWLSRRGEAIGAICQNGPSDLDSVRGTILKLSWQTVEGSYEQEFVIDEVRGEMMACGGQDGRIRIVWADPRQC
jgi:hypothetical protein